MMSYLYPEDEVTFDKSGFGPLPDMLESYAEEEANSYFELYFEYPLFNSHERGDYNQVYVNMSDYLVEGNQVTYKPSHSREPHAFRIYKTDKQVERGIILVWARTRTADLRGNPVRRVVSNGAPVSSALRALELASEETHPFSFTTNIQSNISFEKNQTNVLDALAGEEDSILAITGGQMIRSNNNIYIGINESSENVVEFRLGKNIEGLSYEVDYSNMVTAVIPFYTQTYKLVDDIRDEIVRDSSGKIVKNANGSTKYNRTVGKKREPLDNEVIVYGDTVFSPYANDYSTPFYIFVEIRDDREDPGADRDPLPPFTKADINNRAVDWFNWEENIGIDEPEVYVTVDVQDISQSSEYSHDINLSKLETLNVFDKALVYVPEVGIDMDMEINYVRYDGVAEKNLEVRLGTTLTSLRETILSPQQRAFNQRVQKLDRELAKTAISSDGKSRVYWMATKPTGSFEIGDLWFDISLDGGIYVWDGYDWVAKLPPEFGTLIEDSVNQAIEAADLAMQEAQTNADQALLDAKAYADAKAASIKQEVDSSVNTAISTAEGAKQTAESSYANAVAEAERLTSEQSTAFNAKFEENTTAMNSLSQATKDADAKAQSALTKAGVNANLLTTHQNTLNTIKNTTIPNVNKVASDAMAEAKSALSSASSAMDEAKKADGKIADYVTKKGLVNGTTVDSKIDTATGEISKKITTVESKIPTEIGGRNLLPGTHSELKPYTKSNWDFDPQRIDSSKLEYYGIKVGTKLTYRIYIDNPSENALAHIQFVKKPVAYVQYYGNQIKAGQSGYSTLTLEVSNTDLYQLDYIQIAVRGTASAQTTNLAKKKLEIGSIPTDWTPAPEDNYTQSEFAIFESTYNEDVKGINSTLTELSNKKLDGSTYTTFYDNEYKKTAQGVTDTYAKVNKIIDANGNSTDAFAKAVYDRNATRQSADFNEVTKDLVKTATYSEGVKGINQSISTIRGDLDSLKIGGRNLISGTDDLTNIFGSGYGGASIKYHKDYEVADAEWGKTTKATRVVITNASGTSGVFTTANHFKMIFGKPYTLSFYVKNLGQNRIQFKLNGLKINPDGTGTQSIFVDGGESGKFSATGYMRNNPEWNWFQILPTPASGVTSMDFAIAYLQVEEGNFATDWTPALADQMGKAEFTVFKNDYDETAKKVERRLTAIDSSAEGSVVTRLNKTESTASGNSKLITTINKNYVTQKNIDDSILSDKQIIDTRDKNEAPSYYYSNYQRQEVKEFKRVAVMGVGSGNYGILTTNVPWTDSSGGRVQQTFDTETEKFTRQGQSGWSAWVKQIDTADSTYQKITETSSLYERILGSKDETSVKSNISRIVQTSGIIQSEVTSAVPNPNLLSGTDFTEGLGDVREYNRTPTLSEASYFPYGKIATINTPETSGTANLGFAVRIPKKDTWYTLSFYGLTNWVGSKGVDFYSENIKNKKNYKAPLIEGSSPSRHKIQITVQVSQDNAPLYVRPQGNVFGGYSNIVFYGVKLELGEVATPWENSDPASSSKITQLADNINLKVSKGDISNQININSQGVVIKGNKIALSGDTTVDGTFWTKQVNAVKVKADKIEGTTAQFASLRSSMLTANTITSTMINANTALFDMLFSTTSATTRLVARGAWITNANIVSLDASKITAGTINSARLNSGAIVTAGLSANVVKSTHIQAGTALVDKIFSSDAYITRLTGKTAFVSSIQAISINASKITSGTLDASKITVKNLDASSITANQANLIKAGFKSSSGGSLELNGDLILSTASDSSQVYIGQGILGVRNTAGATIGQFGYQYSGGSPITTIQNSWGSHFRIMMRRDPNHPTVTNKEVFYIVSGGTEMYLKADDVYLEPANRAHINSPVTIRDEVRMQGSSIVNPYGIDFIHGGSLYTLSGGGETRLEGSGRLSLRVNRSEKMRIDTTRNYMYQPLNMKGNGIFEQSDERIKTNIRDISQDSLAIVKGTHFADYEMVKDGRSTFGFIAQQLQTVAPHLIFEEDGRLTYDTIEWTQTVAHGLQQLDNKVDDEVAQLKAQIATLQKELATLKGD